MFGKFHPLIVHLPIGIFFLNIIFVFLLRREEYGDAIKKILPLMILLGMASAVLACATGWFLSKSGGYDDEILFKHQWLGISLAAFSVFIYFSNQKENRWLWSLMTALLTLTGHFGGTLTHGENYLTFNALADEPTKTTPRKVFTNKNEIQESLVFQDWVQPILNEKCISCHNSKKLKGKLRLDAQEFISKGGEHGMIIKVGAPEESEIYKRLILDITDEHHMAPKGKPQPTASEIEIIKNWIADGAAFDKKVKDSPLVGISVGRLVIDKSKLETNQPTDQPTNRLNPIEKVNENILEPLKKMGIVIIPIEPTTNYLSVTFASFSFATDSDVVKLLPIAKQITWLNLGNTKISDAALQIFSQFPNLTRLYLNNTAVSDVGLKLFPSFKNLEYLNLINTHTSVKGLSALSSNTLPRLKKIFLFNTKVLPQDSVTLKQLFPNTKIDFGGYQVSTLTSDTSVFKRK